MKQYLKDHSKPKRLKSITYAQFVNETIDYFLGKDWVVVDPLGLEQILVIALDEIKHKTIIKI